MKVLRQGLVAGLIGVLTGVASAQERNAIWDYSEEQLAALHQGLRDAVVNGCPARFEDVYMPMANDTAVANDLWTVNGVFNQADKDAFEAEFRSVNPTNNGIASGAPSEAEVSAVMNSADAIRYECNAHRLNLLQYVLNLNENETSSSITAATGVLNAIDFASDGWERGDVRVTGRDIPTQGWLFLDGKTVGPTGSGAYHAGDQYQELFEMVVGWGSTQVTGTWSDGGTVALPDLRGRSVIGKNNMGGSVPSVAANALTTPILDLEAGKIGGTFGKAEYPITVSNMPSHNHGMNDGGQPHSHDSVGVGNHSHGMNNSSAHSHSMGMAGAHGHSVRTSVYDGSTVPNWGPYFEGKGRPGYQSTKTAPILAAPNHNHSIGNSGIHKHTVHVAGGHDHAIQNTTSLHKHTVLNAGGSTPITTTSPGAAFNVEMKY